MTAGVGPAWLLNKIDAHVFYLISRAVPQKRHKYRLSHEILTEVKT